MGETSLRITDTFKMWGRNAKVLIATEPFWSIPMSWVFFYRPIFLHDAIGLSEIEIGLLSTVLTFFSVSSPLVGGYLADRFGRKRVLMLFDTLGWLTSMTIWIVTRNIWYALAAYILEGMTSIIFSVWECMLVEDTKPEYRAGIYGSVSASFNIGSLSMPLAGLVIGLYGVNSGCRTLFTLTLLSMMLMFAIRQTFLRETDLGYEIMREKKFAGMKGYLDSLSMIRRSHVLTALLLVSVLGSFYMSVSTYLSLYLTSERGVGLSEEMASLMPMASSISSLVIALLVVPKLASRSSYIKALALGGAVGGLAVFLLIYAPKGSIPVVLVTGALLGIYGTTAFSVSKTFLTNEIEAVDNRARAKILSITITLSSLLNLPTPAFSGYLFSLEPRLPFIMLFATVIVMLLTLIPVARRK